MGGRLTELDPRARGEVAARFERISREAVDPAEREKQLEQVEHEFGLDQGEGRGWLNARTPAAGAGRSERTAFDDKKPPPAGKIDLLPSSQAAQAPRLVLDPAQPAESQVQRLAATHLGIPASNIAVTRSTSGRSGDDVFLLRDKGGAPLGVFKVFHHPEQADREVDMLTRIAGKHLQQYQPVESRGVVPVVAGGVTEAGLFMEMVPGRTVAQEVEQLPAPGAARTQALDNLSTEMVQVANALAEFHTAFTVGNPPAVQNKAERQSQADHVLSRLDELPQTPDLAQVRQALAARVLPDFIDKGTVPVTAWHGDFNLGNMVANTENAPVRGFDVGTMASSFDKAGNVRGNGTTDVGRFVQCLQSWPKADGKPALTPAEGRALGDKFLAAYAHATGLEAGRMDPAVLFSRAEYELTAYRFAKNPGEAAAAMARLKGLLGLS